MHIVTQFPHEITDELDAGIVMSDGCRLSARVLMPDDAQTNPVPAILEYIPYRKRDGTVERDEMMHKYFAGRGYAVARVDIRGNGESQGLMSDEYTQSELDDAVEVINWLAQQSWCTGAVGMMGKSWGGFNGIQTAMLQPKPLKAIITVCSSVDRFADDIHYKGGCLLNENLGWSGTMLSYSSRPPDPALVGECWREMWMERLNNNPLLGPRWMEHPRRDDYWKHGSLCEGYSSIKVPVLSIGGWADNYMNTVAHLIENLDTTVKGIVGPWVHQYPHTADPAPQIGFLQEATRWWDHWLKGIDNGVVAEPQYRTFLQGSQKPDRKMKAREGHWIAMENWPDKSIEVQVSHFAGDRTLVSKPQNNIQLIVASPLDCGFGTGRYFPMGGAVPEQPGDQRDDDARSVFFDGHPTSEATDIVGAPVVNLTLEADKIQSKICVRLCDVAPDGSSMRITYGLLNLCHHESHETPKSLVPGEKFNISVRLDQISYKLHAGHRLRVAISNAYWPLIWPTPERDTLTLHSGSLELPVRPTSHEAEWQFAEPEVAEPWKRTVITPSQYVRTVTTDQMNGEVSLNVLDDYGVIEDDNHGLRVGTVVKETLRIHPDDPLCASGDIAWTQTLSRGDWSVRTEVQTKQWSDATDFFVTARVEGYEGDNLVFERDYDAQIERDFQ
jgi:putative CocE/NonD family hydrolase